MKLPPIYYEAGRYWSSTAEGQWLFQNLGAVRRILKIRHGLDPNNYSSTEHVGSDMETALYEIENKNAVAFAGPLAGYKAGLRDIHGQKVLVTESPRIVKAEAGKWPTLKRILTDQFEDQLPYFLAWLQQSRKCLESGAFAPAPAIALAGDAGSGKSLLQSLITEMLGGRSARAYRYMSGKTDFNLDLFKAEHLMIEDDMPLKDMVSRRMLGSQIKSFLFNEVQSLHAKGRDAVSLAVFWRLSISLNSEPENLMVLPPMDDSLKDKLLLFLVKGSDVFPRPDKRAEFREKISKEIPGFLHYLKRWTLPKSVQTDGRSGIPIWHHPELIKGLHGLAPESKLWDLINDAGLWGEDRKIPWEGSSTELERAISSKFFRESSQIFTHPNSCGTFLARLSKLHGNRISVRTLKGKSIWKIWGESENP